ncbi:MAG: phospho-sugar mutase [Filifactoraceae bacterium]
MNTKEGYKKNYNNWMNNLKNDRILRAELDEMMNNDNIIKECFYKNLEFGTGGLRGIIGVGTNRINKYTVRKATQGLANYLIKMIDSGKSVAIAYDSRNFSKEFALEAALVLVANGIKTYLFESLRPTPELSYAVRFLKCNAGIVITASHNPKEYNGYKVYGSDGGQITLEMAEGIIKEINTLDVFQDIKIVKEEIAEKGSMLAYIGEEIDRNYLENVSKITKNQNLNESDRNIKIVYTPLHGSGLLLITKILEKNGYKNVYLVNEQIDPDGNFPTVKSPNPEERESLAMAIEMAKKIDADIVLGTDPDGDRVGVAIKYRGEYRLLTGNQIGALLSYYIVNNRFNPKNNDAIVKTIVTSELGASIAESKGVKVFNTLTGFKFIGEKIKEFEENNSYNFLLGYEESYGYLAGTFVRDKDAIIASALITEMVAYYQSKGLSPIKLLEQIYNEYGYYTEELESFIFKGIEGQAKIQQIVRDFKDRDKLLETFENIDSIEDYELRKVYRVDNNIEIDLELPKSDVIKVKFKDKSWFAIRPSGTEPKLKIYYSMVDNKEDESKNKLNKIKGQISELINIR